MKFLIISHAELKMNQGVLWGYGPYIREMNLWLKHVDSVEIVSPISSDPISEIDIAIVHEKIKFTSIPSFNITTPKEALKTIFCLPSIFYSIYIAMRRADHIHLRCPGNVGLVGTFIQMFFPRTPKTAKYAGNWDWKSKQPWSYRVQQRILRNTWLTRNMQVLVYGEWPDQTKNMLPFFTATYKEQDKKEINKPPIENGINLIFVGGLTPGKRPELAIQSLVELRGRGIEAKLTFCGDGIKRVELEHLITHENLGSYVRLLGNVSAERVKREFQNAHFLLFASKSEGWPKVIAEAMWWGCIPITTAVSCVPEMVGNGERGLLIKPDVNQITKAIIRLLGKNDEREVMMQKAMIWSRQFTLERFENDIKNLIMA